MKITSKFAVIFGVTLLIIACGMEDIIGICCAALLAGFGAQVIYQGG